MIGNGAVFKKNFFGKADYREERKKDVPFSWSLPKWL